MVWVGLISYSLYLVHWPIIVFANQQFAIPLSAAGVVSVIILSFILGATQYYFVELPFRSKRILPGTRIAGFATATMALLIATACHAAFHQGWIWRYPEDIRKLMDRTHFEEDVAPYPRYCFILPTMKPTGLPAECYSVDPSSPKNNI